MNEMNILRKILKMREADVARAKLVAPPRARASARGKRRSLASRLRDASGPCIIAEMKRASPSAGILLRRYDPAGLARLYAESGATAISVLTEPHFFKGAVAHLRDARRATRLPVLRKDFIFDPWQVRESAECGADVVLLIAAALDRMQLRSLYEESRRLGMETLVEAHTAAELRRALELEDAIIGVNTRNLATLKTDLAVARRLAPLIPENRLAVAESGIRTAGEILSLWNLGYRGFLVGHSLLKSADPGSKLAELLKV